MKNLILALTLLTSFPAFAGADFIGNKIASIKKKGSASELTYTRDGKDMYFYLTEQGDHTLLKKVTIKQTSEELTISGETNQYRFNILNATLEFSGEAYRWCWVPYSGRNDGFRDFAPAAGGVLLLPLSLPLCAVAPGIPALVGIILSPVEGAIMGIQSLVDADNVAARKFSKLVSGKSTHANKKVFQSLIDQIANDL